MAESAARVLLIEDDPHELVLALRVLEASGLGVGVARDGVEALQWMFSPDRVAHPSPDFVLLDLKLPGIDGLEVARRLKADSGTRAIPVVVFSSSAEPRDIRRGYDAGINSYIVKPVDYGQLASILGTVAHYWCNLNRREPGSP